MPGQLYVGGEQPYYVRESRQEAFFQEFPNAESAQLYKAGDDTVAVRQSKLEKFQEEFPDAQSIDADSLLQDKLPTQTAPAASTKQPLVPDDPRPFVADKGQQIAESAYSQIKQDKEKLAAIDKSIQEKSTGWTNLARISLDLTEMIPGANIIIPNSVRRNSQYTPVEWERIKDKKKWIRGLPTSGGEYIGLQDVQELSQVLGQFGFIGGATSKALSKTSAGRRLLQTAQSGKGFKKIGAKVGKSILDFNIHNLTTVHPADVNKNESLITSIEERVKDIPQTTLNGSLFGLFGSAKSTAGQYGGLFTAGYATTLLETGDHAEAFKSGVLLTAMHAFQTLGPRTGKQWFDQWAEKKKVPQYLREEALARTREDFEQAEFTSLKEFAKQRIEADLPKNATVKEVKQKAIAQAKREKVSENIRGEAKIYTQAPNQSTPDRNKLLAQAHILERDRDISQEERERIKTELLGFKSLQDANSDQIANYINAINWGKQQLPKDPRPQSVSEAQRIEAEQRALSQGKLTDRITERLIKTKGEQLSFGRKFWSSLETEIRRFGLSGQKFVVLKKRAMDYANKRLKPAERQIEEGLDEVPKEVYPVLDRIIENPTMKGVDPKTRKFLNTWKKIGDDIAVEGRENVNPEMRKIENYFPLMLKPEIVDLDFTSKRGQRYIDYVRRILTHRTGESVSRETAEQQLREHLNRYKKYGYMGHFYDAVFRKSSNWDHNYYLEMHRDRMLPNDAYERDVSTVLHSYINSAYQTIGQAKYFGNQDGRYNYDQVDKLLTQIQRQGGDVDRAKDFMAAGLRLEPLKEDVSRANAAFRNIGMFLLTFKTAIKNTGDLSKAAALSDSPSLIKSVFSPWFNSEYQQLAKDVIGSKQVFKQTLEQVGISGKFADEYTRAILFQKSERFVRTRTAISAIHWSEQQLKQYRKKPDSKQAESAKRRFAENWDLDLQEIAQQGKLTYDQRLQIGDRAIRMTQPTTAMDVPYYWSKPTGRTIAQFKSFGFMSLKFTKNFTLRELKFGNRRPLLRFLTWGVALQIPIEELTSFIFPKDDGERKGAWERMLGYVGDFAQSGHFGFISDMLFVTKYPGWMSPLVGLWMGPSISMGMETSKNIFTGVGRVARGEEEPLEPLLRQAAQLTIRRVPFVGEELYEDTFD